MTYEATWQDRVLEVNLQKTTDGKIQKAQVMVKGVKEEGDLADMQIVAKGIADISSFVLGSYYFCDTFELKERE